VEGGCTGYGVMLLIIPVSFLMPDLAFTIGSKIFACFLHEKASKYDNHHYIQLFSVQKPGNLLQNLFCIAQHTCTLLTELKHLSTNSGK